MNRLLLLLGKYIVLCVVATVMIVVGLGYLFVIAPKLASIQGSTSKEMTEKQARRESNEREIQQLRSIEEDLRHVTSAEQRRLEAVLPSSAELDDLYIQFSDIASELGLSMVNLEFSGAGSAATADEKQAIGGDIQTLDVTYTVDGVDSYDSLKQLLGVLQDNIRLIDMNSLSYTPETKQYSLVLKLYYFDNGKENTP